MNEHKRMDKRLNAAPNPFRSPRGCHVEHEKGRARKREGKSSPNGEFKCQSETAKKTWRQNCGQTLRTPYRISTKLKVIWGSDFTHITHAHKDWCLMEHPRLGPGHTAPHPPLREGRHMTLTGQPILNYHSLTSHLNLFLSFSAPFVLSLIIFRSCLWSLPVDPGAERVLSCHCWCHLHRCGSAEILHLSKPVVSSLFSRSVVLFHSLFFKR